MPNISSTGFAGPLRVLLFWVLTSACASAQAAWILTQQSERVLPGQPVQLNLLVVNDGQAPMSDELPTDLTLALRGAVDARVKPVLAEKTASQARMLSPGQFRRYRLSVVMPVQIKGPVIVEGPHGAKLVLLAESSSPGLAGPVEPEADVAPAAQAALATEKLSGAPTPEPALQTYEPIYFLVGRREGVTSARFQLSFRYRIFDGEGAAVRWAPTLGGLYFGYTQTSLWDFSEESSPFRDTTYRPSLYFHEPEMWRSPNATHAVGLAAGVEHESNGQGGDRSRSLNIAYVQPTWRSFLTDDWYFAVAPKLWAYLEKDDNPDIADYRGHADLGLKLGRVDGWLFSANLRKGDRYMGSVQLDASYPLREPFFANAGAYLHFQYFNGYGESLRDYDVKGPAQFRVGLSIVR